MRERGHSVCNWHQVYLAALRLFLDKEYIVSCCLRPVLEGDSIVN